MHSSIKVPEVGRPIKIDGMTYGPTCEQGVVFLFGRLAARLGFSVEHVQVHCPDCFARYRGKPCRIEIEYFASHFEAHRHDCNAVDVVVCWENDWESRSKKYRHIKVIDLKKYVGASRRVFAVGCNSEEGTTYLDRRARIEWNILKSAQVDDLVVIYRAGSGIHDLWKIVGPMREYKRGNKEGYWPGIQAGMRLVTRLNRPISFDHLSRHPLTRDLPVIRRRFQGKTDITEDWSHIYKRIIELNPAARKSLEGYLKD